MTKNHDPFVEELLQSLYSDPAAFLRAEESLKATLKRRDIYFGDGLLPTYVVPYLVPERRVQKWVAQSNALAESIETLAQAALTDRKLFDALKLRPEAQELIRIDPGYGRITALSRPDAIPTGDELTFFEFNCDSPAMMTFTDVVTETLMELPALAGLQKRARPENLTRLLVETLLACYKEFGGSPSMPTVAITDWEGQKTRYEHQAIARFLTDAGCPTVVCDPRAFRLNGSALEVEGRTIHLVYRRALFTEILERQREVEPLLTAYRKGTICMVNSLRSYLASSKTLLALLCERPEIYAGSPASLANSRLVTPALAKELRAARPSKVLKRGESHGGQHVILPDTATATQWSSALDEALSDPWIVQDYHDVPKISVVESRNGAAVRSDKFFNWNPFLFGGRYAGSMARASETTLINISLGGGLLPTLPYV